MDSPLRLVQLGETRSAPGIEPDTPVSDLTAGQLVRLVRDAVRAELDGASPVAADPTTTDGGLRLIPSARKYTYDEVRVRIHAGRDPAAMGEDERARAVAAAPCVRTIHRLVARGHLERVVLSRTPYVTETQVRTYERNIAEGRFRQPAQRRGRRPSAPISKAA
ncbi:MAG TPA: hypothetical protein VGB53_08375 [Rubricoccaceae bacterium]|jgi:hypothetical protein